MRPVTLPPVPISHAAQLPRDGQLVTTGASPGELLEGLPEPLLILDRQWRVVHVNRAFEQRTALARTVVLGRPILDLFPIAGTRWEDELLHAVTARQRARAELHFEPADRRLVVHAWPLEDGMTAIHLRDVTRHRAAHAAARAEEEHARQAEQLARATANRMRAVASAAAGVMAADSLDTLQQVLHDACAATIPFDTFSFAVLDAGHGTLHFPAGPSSPLPALNVPVAGTVSERVIAERRSLVTLSADDPAGCDPSSPGVLPHPQSAIRTPVLAGDTVLGVMSVESATPALYSRQDVEVLEVVAALASTALRNIRLVDDIRRSEEQLAHQTFHDPLTGLANRSLFLDRVGHALARSARQAAPLAVLFIDLDDFKKVNDSLGHPSGDRLLEVAAERLTVCVRGSDTVARLGGDEFAILVEDAHSPSEVLAIANRVAAALSSPFHISGSDLFVTASIGVAPADIGNTADELLRNADVAMYFAKTGGRSAIAIFEPWMQAAAHDRLQLEADMRRGLGRDEFVLHYQPIVKLETGEIIGAEALVRWRHPERGLVPPGEFIPLAEETGLIVPLGSWVLEEACRQGYAWQRALPAGSPPLRVTVNLSSRQLQEPAVVATVRDALASSGLTPAALVLEITESVLMQNTSLTLTRLKELKELGLSLAIDDFGTGYSSLGYLQRFPIDILKIDKAFVDAVGSGGDAALARAVIALGDTLGMQTVAEGIEGAVQVAGLRDLGCMLGQGFHFARPMPAEELDGLVTMTTARLPAS